MIYSKLRQESFTPRIMHSSSPSQEGTFHYYLLFDKDRLVGSVKLIDKENGVKVSLIENKAPTLYKGLGCTADQLEVEHCLNRGFDPHNISITSEAALNSHAFHVSRGKVLGEVTNPKIKNFLQQKYGTFDANVVVKKIIEQTKDLKNCNTKFLERLPMFMPQELIKKYIEIIKKTPLLK